MSILNMQPLHSLLYYKMFVCLKVSLSQSFQHGTLDFEIMRFHCIRFEIHTCSVKW